MPLSRRSDSDDSNGVRPGKGASGQLDYSFATATATVGLSVAAIAIATALWPPPLSDLTHVATAMLGSAMGWFGVVVISALVAREHGSTTEDGAVGSAQRAQRSHAVVASALVTIVVIWLCSESEMAERWIDAVEIWQRRVLVSVIE